MIKGYQVWFWIKPDWGLEDKFFQILQKFFRLSVVWYHFQYKKCQSILSVFKFDNEVRHVELEHVSYTFLLRQSLFFSFIADESLCESTPCDENTTECTSGDGAFKCICLESHIPTRFSDRICTGKLSERASVCVCVCVCVLYKNLSLSKLQTLLTFATFAACPSGKRAEGNTCVK